MSRFDEWLPFFEQRSEKRDLESWTRALHTNFLDKGLKVLSIVSDRAKALVKLGSKSYLDVVSMPDCFHFQQDIGRLAGLQIGRKYQKVQTSQRELVQQELVQQEVQSEVSADQITSAYKAYRVQSAQINKTIHPFDEQNNWSDGTKINKSLLQCVRSISHLAEGIGINIDLSKATKVLHQIPGIVKGIESWVSNTQAKIQHWLDHGLINEVEKQWYSSCLLPLMYWQCQLSRTKNSRSNSPLVKHYEAQVQQAKVATLEQADALNIDLHRQEQLAEMAHQMANSFQRASSQVEGRNGYLAFIHHAHKGIPKKKMEALTIIHNFDIRRVDGSTPAQRLFKTDFPDLFEFLCDNVTGFKEPRKRKNKPLIVSYLQG